MSRRECLEYSRVLAMIVARRAGEHRCMMLSGGIDTSFIAVSHPSPSSLRLYTLDLGGDDIFYATKVAGSLGVREHIILRPDKRIFEEAVDWVLRNFVTIDPVEVAGDAVHYIVLSRALRDGCGSIVSGDGGDELFIGYRFLLERDESYIREWIERMSRYARMPTVEIGRRIGIEVVTPLYNEETRALVKKIPIGCLVDPLGRYGKYFMRLYLEERGLGDIAWREKTPVTTGTGAISLLKKLAEERLRESIDDTTDYIEKRAFFRPPTRAHLYLTKRLLDLGVELPPVYTGEGSCPVCRRRMENRFCRFCGTYIDERGSLYHYRDD